MTFHYFAYGSNMLTARLVDRCPSTRVAGLAYADGYKLSFAKLSIDKSGKATLVQQAGQRCSGVLFEIDLAEQAALDKFEGADYRRDDAFPVVLADGSAFSASTYLARETTEGLVPYHWYLALIIAGCHEHKLDAGYVRELRMVKHAIDEDLNRKTHKAAIHALKSADITDIAKFLGSG